MADASLPLPGHERCMTGLASAHWRRRPPVPYPSKRPLDPPLSIEPHHSQSCIFGIACRYRKRGSVSRKFLATAPPVVMLTKEASDKFDEPVRNTPDASFVSMTVPVLVDIRVITPSRRCGCLVTRKGQADAWKKKAPADACASGSRQERCRGGRGAGARAVLGQGE